MKIKLLQNGFQSINTVFIFNVKVKEEVDVGTLESLICITQKEKRLNVVVAVLKYKTSKKS